MISISLCMIVKNEEAVLRRCLESVKDAVDEIIILDTGSEDQTVEIAKTFTNHVYHFTWIDDFSAARNASYAFASKDYQLWLDADDVLPEEELQKLIDLKKTLSPDVDMVTMKYHTHFDEDGTPILTSTRERLSKRENHYRWQDPIHEYIPLSGNVFYSDIAIHHKKPPTDVVSTRNLDIYESMEKKGVQFTPRQTYYFARELKDHRHYAKAIYYFLRFLNDGKGWTEDNIACCLNLSFCYRALDDEKSVLPILLRSFEYDAPRSEICCEIGHYYQRQDSYQTAMLWFELATTLRPPSSLGFILEDYQKFIPYLELCVCYCHLHNYEKAREYLSLAKMLKPTHPAVLQNEQYLERIHFDMRA